MRHTSFYCDQTKHGECDGTCVYIDQDGHSKYRCDCGCHDATRRAEESQWNVKRVLSLMHELGVDRTHDLVERSK